MPRSPAKSPASRPEKVYLFNCPFDEKDNAKRAGAKWDGSAGCWYVLSSQNLEPFNQWHPNERKYLVCSYEEKDDAKREGAKWDAACKQWYIDAGRDETGFARWLPTSSAGTSAKKAGKAKAKTTKAPTQSQIATIPRINNDMTVAQLQAECKARDPSIRGLTTKKKEWFLDYLEVGSVWISAENPTADNHDDEPPAPKTLAKPKPKPVKATKSGNSTVKKNTKPVFKISLDMTATQLQLECRARDPTIKGISNKNKSWLVDHLKIGSKWKSHGWTEEDLPSSDSVVANQAKVPPKQPTTSKKKDSIAPKKKKDDGSSGASKKNNIRKEPPAAKKAPPTVAKQSISNKSQPKKRPIKEEPKDTIVLKPQSEPSRKKQKVKQEEAKADAPISLCMSQTKPPPKPATAAKAKTDTNRAPKAPSYTRINGNMTLAKLKEEAKVRQIHPKNTPKLKAELLHHLVEGSICVHESAEYKSYQAGCESYRNVLQKVRDERSMHLEASLTNYNNTLARRRELEQQRWNREQQRLEKESQEREEKRQLEIAQQKSLHMHSFPRVHRCLMAKTEKLMKHGSPRRANCDICERQFLFFSTAIYSCDQCDFDICKSCFDEGNMSKAEKEKLRMKREKEREEEEEEQRKAEEERLRRWDANQRFNSTIMKVEGKHINPRSGLKFTVWCSDGYDYDGWHSYEGEPTKEFDSVWKTKEEANLRSEYLFFWKNPWGWKPEETELHWEIEQEVVDGLKRYTVAPPDSSRWTVGVVPTAAFIHLPNASTDRHTYDRDCDTDDEQYDEQYMRL